MEIDFPRGIFGNKSEIMVMCYTFFRKRSSMSFDTLIDGLPWWILGGLRILNRMGARKRQTCILFLNVKNKITFEKEEEEKRKWRTRKKRRGGVGSCDMSVMQWRAEVNRHVSPHFRNVAHVDSRHNTGSLSSGKYRDVITRWVNDVITCCQGELSELSQVYIWCHIWAGVSFTFQLTDCVHLYIYTIEVQKTHWWRIRTLQYATDSSVTTFHHSS